MFRSSVILAVISITRASPTMTSQKVCRGKLNSMLLNSFSTAKLFSKTSLKCYAWNHMKSRCHSCLLPGELSQRGLEHKGTSHLKSIKQLLLDNQTSQSGLVVMSLVLWFVCTYVLLYVSFVIWHQPAGTADGNLEDLYNEPNCSCWWMCIVPSRRNQTWA